MSTQTQSNSCNKRLSLFSGAESFDFVYQHRSEGVELRVSQPYASLRHDEKNPGCYLPTDAFEMEDGTPVCFLGPVIENGVVSETQIRVRFGTRLLKMGLTQARNGGQSYWFKGLDPQGPQGINNVLAAIEAAIAAKEAEQ